MVRGKSLLFLSFFLFVYSNSKAMICRLQNEGEKRKFEFTYKRVTISDQGQTLRYELKKFETDGKTEIKTYIENKNGAPILLENNKVPKEIKLALLERINKRNDSKKRTSQ